MLPVEEKRIFNSDQLDKFIYLMVKMDFTKACDYVNHKPKGIFNNLIIYILQLTLLVKEDTFSNTINLNSLLI